MNFRYLLLTLIFIMTGGLIALVAVLHKPDGSLIQINDELKVSIDVPVDQIVEFAQLAKDEIKNDAREEGSPVIERVITSSQLWRPIQDQVSNTVVQVWAQISAMDLLQPYKTPHQGTATGSGFFVNINGQAHIITNAHVVNEAKVWVQIPWFGKTIFDVDIIGVSPDRDLALLKVIDKHTEIIKNELGKIPYLQLGDSNAVRRSDDVLALGYPLGQQSLKSTTGVISGREQHFLQISAPINPGSSGGPLLDAKGFVVGVNSAGITEAQNVGYAIPVDVLKATIPQLMKTKLLRKPFLGMRYQDSNDELTKYLGNPPPGGCYVVEVVKNSPLEKAGAMSGDMLYALNNIAVDKFGEMRVPDIGIEGKISIVDYLNQLPLGEKIKLTMFRNGIKKELIANLDLTNLPAIHEIYPGYEIIDYEVIAGLVIMPLTLNHLPLLGQRAPGLGKYLETKHQLEPALVVTHVLPTCQASRSRSMPVGSTINEINGIKVQTMEDLRKAIRLSATQEFLTIKISDNASRKSDNVLVVLDWKKVIEEEQKLSQDYKYQITNLSKELLQLNKSSVIFAQKES